MNQRKDWCCSGTEKGPVLSWIREGTGVVDVLKTVKAGYMYHKEMAGHVAR